MLLDELFVTIETDEVEIDIAVDELSDIGLILKSTPEVIVLAAANVGKQGLVGPEGPKGDIGPTGVKGDIGLTGATGAVSTVPGPIGPIGPTGAASTIPGPTGPKGDIGVIGPPGAASTVPGPTGPTGAAGAAGASPNLAQSPNITLKPGVGMVAGLYSYKGDESSVGALIQRWTDNNVYLDSPFGDLYIRATTLINKKVNLQAGVGGVKANGMTVHRHPYGNDRHIESGSLWAYAAGTPYSVSFVSPFSANPYGVSAIGTATGQTVILIDVQPTYITFRNDGWAWNSGAGPGAIYWIAEGAG
jgi:hypothetical protein